MDKIFAKWRNFEVVANFFVKTVTGSMFYQPVSQWHSLHFELLIELVAKKLTELWRFKNLAYFLTWWPSSMTYLFVNVTYWNCSPIPYVDQVWWWYVKAFMSYAWQNWQTNRQTDRRTDKPTNEHTCQNCKFWQVINNQTDQNVCIICRIYHICVCPVVNVMRNLRVINLWRGQSGED